VISPGVNPTTNDKMILYYCLMIKVDWFRHSTVFSWVGFHTHIPNPPHEGCTEGGATTDEARSYLDLFSTLVVYITLFVLIILCIFYSDSYYFAFIVLRKNKKKKRKRKNQKEKEKNKNTSRLLKRR
jgi:hypothetical protein